MFEVVVKPRKHVGLNNLSRIELGEVGDSLDDDLLNAQIFYIKVVPYQFNKITTFLVTCREPKLQNYES